MQSAKVFISYSQDSPEHMTEVLGLCNRLRQEGVDCDVDRYHPAPPGGWAAWTTRALAEAEFVLVVCSPALHERYEGTAAAGAGKGAKWEGAIILGDLYESESRSTKYIPVLLSSGEKSHIPIALRGTPYYDLDAADGYEALYRRLTDQPEVERPDLGPVRELPSHNVEWSSTSRPSDEVTTINFVDDLLPDETDVYEASLAVAAGRQVSIRWSELNDDLFERFSVRRPDLRRQLTERGVDEGLPMVRSIEAFDLALSTASRQRDGAADRIPLMWAGMKESSYWSGLVDDAFRDALKNFLVLANLYALRNLGQVQFEEDRRELPAGMQTADSDSVLFQRPAVAAAFDARPPFWAADVVIAEVPFYVYAPKEMAEKAYRKGAGEAGTFMRSFLVPQTELRLLGRDKQVIYEPGAVRILKVRDEHFEEPDYPGEAFGL
ncbi:MAG: SEFIR domain-containing protein [Solirubrobacterales bacterium]